MTATDSLRYDRYLNLKLNLKLKLKLKFNLQSEFCNLQSAISLSHLAVSSVRGDIWLKLPDRSTACSAYT